MKRKKLTGRRTDANSSSQRQSRQLHGQYERIHQTFCSVVIIPPQSNDSKAVSGIKGARCLVVECHFQYDPVSAAQPRFGAYRIEKREPCAAPPIARQNAEGNDFGLGAKRDSQRESDRVVLHPCDPTKKTGNMHNLVDRIGFPRIFGKARAVKH